MVGNAKMARRKWGNRFSWVPVVCCQWESCWMSTYLGKSIQLLSLQLSFLLLFWTKLGERNNFGVSTMQKFRILNEKLKYLVFVNGHLARAKNGWRKKSRGQKGLRLLLHFCSYGSRDWESCDKTCLACDYGETCGLLSTPVLLPFQRHCQMPIYSG